jgi:DNA-binding NarL/FixJ family response regulator
MEKIGLKEKERLIMEFLKENPGALENLTNRQKEVIKLRYGLEDGKKRSLQEVCNELGITKERVSQIELKVFKKFFKNNSLIQPKEKGRGEKEFTSREKEILDLLAEGFPSPEIAEKLEISPQTVKNYLSKIYLKLGVKNRLAAIRKLRELKGEEKSFPVESRDFGNILTNIFSSLLEKGGECHLTFRKGKVERLEINLFKE